MTARRHVLNTLDSPGAHALCLVVSLLMASVAPSLAWSQPPQGSGAAPEEEEVSGSSRQETATPDDESAVERSKRDPQGRRPLQRDPAVQKSSPFVPRLQGPGEDAVMNSGRHAWGVSMLGAGGLASGAGLLLLRANAPDDCTRSGCQEQNNARLNLGAGLLLSGVFVGGLGLYIMVSESRSAGPRIITTTPLRARGDAILWRVGLEPAPGGALIQSRVDF